MRSLRDLLDEILARIEQVEGMIGNALEPGEGEDDDDEETEED